MKMIVFIVYGYGRMRMTFVWKALSVAICSKGKAVLNVASKDIASLFQDGNIAYSPYKSYYLRLSSND